MDDSEEHDIDVVRSRLIQRYPDLDPEVVEDLIVVVLARFDGCRIRNFVPLLVERAATRTLDATYSHPPAYPETVRTLEVPTTAHPEPAVRSAPNIRGVRRIFAPRSPRLS
ncbi:hypothetical protein CJ179_37660 [Rhodococcus sp. ACS1]|uniref:three-helix bundle dimerization domain-containing protein n=1 Tax=Rhodococcus sp. ACS1 TaxID=2028570 RepID=UPI000BB144BC|nr:hypothetical protein [Rhodococcus sp. ACS1]PBC39170.1 hypothetical protein CJ179_37660 [Rhodococcus sp. ACS1]